MTLLERACVVILGPANELEIGGPVGERVIRYYLSLLIEVKQDAFEFATVHVRIQLETVPYFNDVDGVVLVPVLGELNSLQNRSLQSLLVQIQVVSQSAVRD